MILPFFRHTNTSSFILLYTCNKIPMILPFFRHTNTYKFLYYSTILSFSDSVSPSSIFNHIISNKKNPAPDGGYLNCNMNDYKFNIKFITLSYVSAYNQYQRKNIFFCSAVTCVHNVTSSTFWRDVVWYDVPTSRHTVPVLQLC